MQQWDRETIKKWLSKQMTNKRLEHCLGTESVCIQLARLHGVDETQAALAGLTHDCAKSMKDKELIDFAQSNGIEMDEGCWHNPGLLHAPVGAVVARDVLGIADEAVLQAIRLHTLGDYDMTPLDCILYLADLIEPTRNFSGLQTLRKQANKQLDLAMLTALGQQMTFMVRKKQEIHPRFAQAWNGSLTRMQQEILPKNKKNGKNSKSSEEQILS